ncbi:hypothetical protein RNZ50_18370 [Paracoccaceae bacterium Fryx2]|nr:hypothetical protein [Paracoccaceae bacterium Fryx2]
MSIGMRDLYAACAVLLAVAAAAHAGGMGEPVTEPGVVVEPEGPVTGPVPGGAVFAARRHGGPDRGDGVSAEGVSRTADGRVLCLAIPAARRGGAGPFDLCQP